MKGKVKVVKNIDQIIKTYDRSDYNGEPYGLLDKRKNLRAKIDQDNQNIKEKIYKNKDKPENSQEFL